MAVQPCACEVGEEKGKGREESGTAAVVVDHPYLPELDRSRMKYDELTYRVAEEKEEGKEKVKGNSVLSYLCRRRHSCMERGGKRKKERTLFSYLLSAEADLGRIQRRRKKEKEDKSSSYQAKAPGSGRLAVSGPR